jgi:hypothetical protein
VLARQDRPYRFGGRHNKDLSSIGPHEPLGCSAAASLILLQAGLLEPGPAWISRRLAESWGEPDEGRYVTVWANKEHVWVEFKLDSDHGERFDPTPSRRALTTDGCRPARQGPTRGVHPTTLARPMKEGTGRPLVIATVRLLYPVARHGQLSSPNLSDLDDVIEKGSVPSLGLSNGKRLPCACGHGSHVAPQLLC